MIQKLIRLAVACMVFGCNVQGMDVTDTTLVEQQKKNDGLVTAAAQGDLQAVKRWHKKGAAIDAQNTTTNLTPLHAAVSSGSTKIVRYLLEKGAQIDRQNSLGLTALGLAALQGHDRVVQLLLGHKASMEVVDAKGYTVLHYASVVKAEIVKLLLEAKARVNAQITSEGEDNGCTPLHGAAQMGNVAVIRLLSHYGAHIEACDAKSLTPLHAAAGQGKADAVICLLELNANSEARDRGGFTPLHHAAAKNHIEVARTLLQHGAEPDPVSNGEREKAVTPQELAQSKAHTDIVKLINSVVKSKSGCSVCAKTKKADGVQLLKCSACLICYYCSAECQKVDWEAHRPLCKRKLVIIERANE